jgi:hypothetical protein
MIPPQKIWFVRELQQGKVSDNLNVRQLVGTMARKWVGRFPYKRKECWRTPIRS